MSTTTTVPASTAPVRVPRKQGAIVKAYLFLYNIIACAGWSIVLFTTVTHYLNGGKPDELYPKIEYWLKIAQTLALVEVLNSLLGFVSSPVFTTIMQVASRIYILWGVLNLEGDHHYTQTQSIAVTTLMFAWATTEIIRYSFYGLKIYDICPYVLVWLRYTTFYILYPIGVSSELACLFFRANYIYENRPYSIHMPNKYNWSFDSFLIIPVVCVAYIFVFPMLYGHMISQRKKTLGAPVADKKKQ